jgi:hypothetical protein
MGRDDSFREAKKVEVVADKKIIKTFEVLCGYFKGARVENNNVICASVMHEHTGTKLLCDISLKNGIVQMEYEHRLGEEVVSEYIIKCIGFLLRKE